MKIQIKSGSRDTNISLPNWLVINKLMLRGMVKVGKTDYSLQGISTDAADAILAEMKRIKEKYGCWELVEVDSADGEKVIIKL